MNAFFNWMINNLQKISFYIPLHFMLPYLNILPENR